MDMKEIKQSVSQYLLKMGLTTEMTGYRYLCEAVAVYIGKNFPESIAQAVFPVIASRAGTSVAAVERSCTAAVRYAWEHKAENLPNGDPMKFDRQPTSAEFIKRLTVLVTNAPQK